MLDISQTSIQKLAITWTGNKERKDDRQDDREAVGQGNRDDAVLPDGFDELWSQVWSAHLELTGGHA